ncbi:hypothetical protein AGMMS50225_22490 [Betaproteobacteria bacterium]|nr:hypothetical protein AGMMS50225_22490 [Betaproteobacteria bacterium]
MPSVTRLAGSANVGVTKMKESSNTQKRSPVAKRKLPLIILESPTTTRMPVRAIVTQQMMFTTRNMHQ